ncbi:MAG TPA: hypothetical protein VFZ89_12345 [Solirubrobacteraceae bacterium]
MRWLGVALAVLLIPVQAAYGATAATLGVGRNPSVAVEPSGVGHAAWLVVGPSVGSDTIKYCRLPRANPTSCQAPQTLTPPAGRGDNVHVLASGGNVYIVLPRYVQNDVQLWTSTGGAPFTGPVTVATGNVGTSAEDAVLGPAGSAFIASSNPATYVQQIPLAGGPPPSASARFSTDFTSFIYGPTIATFGAAATPLLAASDAPSSAAPQVAFWRYGSGDIHNTASWIGPTVVGQGDTPRVAGGPAGLVMMTNARSGESFSNQMQARRYDETTSTFGPPVNVGPREVGHENDLAQAASGGSAAGRLFAVWVRNDTSSLRLSTSSNGGAAWSPVSDIVREPNLFNLRVEVAPDGQGFVVWDQNANDGQVRAAPLIPIAGSGGLDASLKPSQVIKLPSSRKCRSRRSFRIRLVVPKGVIIATASVRVNGKRVKVVRKRRLTSFVNLRGLPKGRYSVKIVVVTEAGKILRSTRRYRTCAPRRRG